jgi:predicted porin
MKKSLIALAALSAFATAAQAQSSVTVYGLLDMGYTNIGTDTTVRSSGATTKVQAVQTGNQGRLSGSRLGFRGVEDLGAGLKASFTVEFGLDAGEQANGISNGTRLGFVDLSSGSLGSVSLGRQVSSTKFVNDSFTAFGNPNFVTGYVTGAGLSTSTTSQTTGSYSAVNNAATQNGLGNANAGERISNLIRYTTPSFNGLQATIGTYKTNTDSSVTAATVIGDANGKGSDAGVRYTSGKLALAVGYNKYETTNGATNNTSVDNTQTSIGASYDLGVAKLFLTNNSRSYETATANSKIDFKDTTAGVSIPFGKTNLIASYSDGEDSSTSSKTDKKGYQVGAVYNLSKRTNAYAVYGSGEATSTNATNSKIKEEGVAIGVRHSF